MHTQVFNDRAEVTRLVTAEVVGMSFRIHVYLLADTTEIIVKGLPKSVKSDSIHVSGGKGKMEIVLIVKERLLFSKFPTH